MVKCRQILGSMVVDLESARGYGRVLDLIFHPEARAAVALILPGKSRLNAPHWVDFENVEEFSGDMTMLKSGVSTVNIGEVRGAKEMVKLSVRKVLGLLIIDSRGTLLGEIQDLFVEVPGGGLSGIEVSYGFLSDMFRGRDFLPADCVSLIGEDAVIVDDWQGALGGDKH